MHRNPGEIYSSKYFDGQADGSARSAATVVPLVLSIFPAKSVVDVGCGVGTWAAEFLARGVQDVWAVDGDYVDRTRLRIPQECFHARDLKSPLQIGRSFELAVCLEVGEHLPESRASGLVADLTCLAPCVLFSAAVPHGGGTGHINEQYLPYWVKLFEAHGFQGMDAIRPWILGNDSVEWFYQQNIVMFAAPQHPLLAKGFPKPQTIIHEELFEQFRRPKLTLKMIATGLPGAILRSLRYHLNQRK